MRQTDRERETDRQTGRDKKYCNENINGANWVTPFW